MRNSEIYRRTLRFSVMRLVLTVVGILIVVLLPLAAFAATAGASEVACVAATAGAFVAGLVAFFFVARYGGYLFTAAQVAMITRGVAAGELPADCLRRRRISCGTGVFCPLGASRALGTPPRRGSL